MKRGVGVMIGIISALSSSGGEAQSVWDVLGQAPVLPLDAGSEPPARLVVDPPVGSALERGLVVIQYMAVNLRIVPVYGPAAIAVSPRIGHIHVTVDEAPWHWADASNEPLIIQSLPPGPHSVRIDLVDANHKPLDHQIIPFEVPARRQAAK